MSTTPTRAKAWLLSGAEASQMLTELRGSTLVLTLSDPASRNSLSPQASAAGLEALARAESDPEVRCVVLRGDGRVVLDAHLTGVATIPEVLPAEQKGKPGYRMALEPQVLTLADRLRAQGYRTIMSGKWHLGAAPGTTPATRGFDRSLSAVAGGSRYLPCRTAQPQNRAAIAFEKYIAELRTQERSKRPALQQPAPSLFDFDRQVGAGLERNIGPTDRHVRTRPDRPFPRPSTAGRAHSASP